MKFIIFGFLVACAFAIPFHFPRSGVDFDAPKIDDPVYFYPAGIPCNVSVTVEGTMYQNVYNESGWYESRTDSVTKTDFYGFMTRIKQSVVESEKNTTTTTTKLLRLDVTETKNGIVYATRFKSDGASCEKELVPMDKAEAEGKKERSLYSTITEFMGVNETIFNGVECNLYYTETNTTAEYLYVDKNNVIIGQFILWVFDNISSMNGTLLFHYDNIELDKFVMDQTENPGCSEAAYKAPPSDFECIGAVYTPNDLPCPFSVKITKTIQTESNTYYDYAELFYEGLLSGLIRDGYSSNISVMRRADLKDKKGVPVFQYEGPGSTCSKSYISRSETAKNVEEEFEFFTKERRFQSLSTSSHFSFGGDTSYASTTSKGVIAILVNSTTNRIVGYSFGNSTSTIGMVIEYPDFSLDSFAFNETEIPGCDPAVYIAPKAEYPCQEQSSSTTGSSSSAKPTPTSSSSGVSSASTHTVSFVVILAMAMVFFSRF